MAGYSFGFVEVCLIAITVAISLYAFNNQQAFNKLKLNVDAVLHQGEWYRILTSGFIHVNGRHLFFNMLSLFFFAGVVEEQIGHFHFGLLYIISLLGGNLLSVFLHRQNGSYSAVGASGAVSGIVFIAIALFPGMQLGLLFLPIPFPAWLFGVGFIAYSIYGIKKQHDGIGHEAHMGGAVCGLAGVLLLYPQLFSYNGTTILLIGIPCLLFILVVFFFQNQLLASPKQQFSTSYKNIDDDYLNTKAEHQHELNTILEKLQKHGYESLTKEEKQFLKHFS